MKTGREIRNYKVKALEEVTVADDHDAVFTTTGKAGALLTTGCVLRRIQRLEATHANDMSGKYALSTSPKLKSRQI